MKTFILALAALVSLHAQAAPATPPTKAEISAAQSTFKFRGQWISPLILKELMPWESDRVLPLVLSVDVAAATGTNRFFGEVTSSANGASAKAGGGTFSYEWIGRAKNGQHVLVTRESGDGTLVSTSLVVAELDGDSGVNEEGKKYLRLPLEVERIVTIGDRAIAQVSISGNTVTVKASFNTSQAAKELKIKLD